MSFANAFLPNERVGRSVALTLSAGWLVLAISLWVFATHGQNPLVALLPAPGQVSAAFAREWQAGLLHQLLGSLWTSIEAIVIATVVGLALVYGATMAGFRAPAILVGNFRFLSLAGITVIFMMMLNGHELKVGILAFSMMTFFVGDMLQVMDDIPQSKFDHARTLGFSRWKVLREVVIRGTLHEAFESVRKNAAIAWMMLTSVEGLVRSEGGIGLLLLSLQRSGNYSAIFAVQLTIFSVGLGQDRLIKYLKAMVCPYTVRR